MAIKSKKFTLMLIFTITLSGLLLIEPTIAPVTMPTNPREAPEIISVVVHNNPVWNPPVTVTDPYTGDVTYSTPGSWRGNGSIEITIRNRPFTAYTDKNGNYVNRYYSFFWKDSNTQWKEDFPRSLQPEAVYQSDSANTVAVFPYGNSGGIYVPQENMIIDFRVQAVEGHFSRSYETRDQNSILPFLYTVPAVYEGVGSKYAEFSIKIPSADKPGTSKLDIHTSSVTPTSSNFNTSSTTNTTVSSTDMPSASDPDNPPAQNPLQSYLMIIFVTACIIIIPIVVTRLLLSKNRYSSTSFR
jgi:hypothetical protein